MGAPADECFLPQKIVSGGQTGVDRGALDAAMALGIGHGGWCPRGRLAEDGSVPSCYELDEWESPEYAARTEQNVLDSDATLVLYEGGLAGGTLLTYRLARRLSKPHRLVKLDRPGETESTRAWLADVRPAVLNVGGPRESSRPGIQRRTLEWLLRLWGS